MKTFLAVALYAAMVAALDLGGAVWQSFAMAHTGKASVAVTAAAASKTERAARTAGTIPSDT